MQNNRIAFKCPPNVCIFLLGPYLLRFSSNFCQSLELGLLESAFGCTPPAETGKCGIQITGSVVCFLLLFLQVARVSPLQITVDVWPKLLQLISKGIDTHLRPPIVDISRKAQIRTGIIEIGNGNRGCVAGKLGNVEHVSPGVSSSDENTVNGIAKAVHERASAQPKIARINF